MDLPPVTKNNKSVTEKNAYKCDFLSLSLSRKVLNVTTRCFTPLVRKSRNAENVLFMSNSGNRRRPWTKPSPIILKHQDFDQSNKRQTQFHGFEKAAKNALKYK